jgi:HK97 family phage portal protein
MAAIQGLRIQANSVKFFANMSRPGGVLTAPGSISDDTAKRIKADWKSGFGGKNIGNVAVLGDGLKYEAMSVNAIDAQLVEQLKWSGETVCSVFHVPTYMVGLAPPPPNNNIEALTQQYLGQCLQSLIESMELSLEEGLDMVTPSASFGVEFDLEGLLRMDTSTRYKSYKDAISAGWMAPNEARHCEDYEPVAGGDTPYLQVQNYSLAALAERDAEGPPSNSPPKAPPVPIPDDSQPDENKFAAEELVIWKSKKVERYGVRR